MDQDSCQPECHQLYVLRRTFQVQFYSAPAVLVKPKRQGIVSYADMVFAHAPSLLRLCIIGFARELVAYPLPII